MAFLEYDIVATQGILSSLELRVQFHLLVCCTCPSSSTMNKEKNLIVQRASLQVDTRKTQQMNWRRRHWDFPHRNMSYRRSYPIRIIFTSIVSTMAETTELIKLHADQIQVQRQQMEEQAKQMEQHSQQHRAEMEQQAQQMEQRSQQMEQHSQQHIAEMEQQAQQMVQHLQQHRAEMEQQAQQMVQHLQQHRAEMEQQAQQMVQHLQQHRAEMEQQVQHHREEMHNLLKILDVQKHGTGEDDSSTHHPQLSTAAIPPFAAFDSTSDCGVTTGQDSAHLWWPMLYLSNAKHKFSSPIKLLLYTNNWLTWLLN